ncbi:MAG: transporter substrate-binding domain-containing protein [Christensenellales bacterium]
MKKIMMILAALVLLLSAAYAEENDLLARIRQKGEIVVATEGAWAPWTYHDENDQLVGFDVEVAQGVAAKLGVTAKFVETEWDGIFAGLDAGRYDMAANGVEVTDERAMKYDFSTPYGYIRTALIVRGDREDIASFEDLAGKRTANSISSTYMLLAESYGATAMGVDTLDAGDGASGRADATLNAEVSFYDYMNVHPMQISRSLRRQTKLPKWRCRFAKKRTAPACWRRSIRRSMSCARKVIDAHFRKVLV